MINVAIVGTGGISHAHIKAYLQFPERCRIAALVDIIPGKAQKVKEQYGLEAEVFLDHHEILNRSDIDLVDVCTPPFVHAEITINALRAGKNVVCEKPVTLSSADLQQYFSKQPWYRPVADNATIQLSDIEKHNVDFIKAIENRPKE